MLTFQILSTHSLPKLAGHLPNRKATKERNPVGHSVLLPCDAPLLKRVKCTGQNVRLLGVVCLILELKVL